ncbi:MAG: hypothetical protein U1E50_00015 [Caulobacteraceae bacterium]
MRRVFVRWGQALVLALAGLWSLSGAAAAQTFGDGNFSAAVSINQALALPPIIQQSNDPTIAAGRTLVADLGLSVASTTVIKRAEQPDENKWALSTGDLNSAHCRDKEITVRIETWLAPRGGTPVLNDVRLARFVDCRVAGAVLVIKSNGTNLTSIAGWYPIWATPPKELFTAEKRDMAKASLAITIGPNMSLGRIVNYRIGLAGRQVSWTGYPQQTAFPAIVTPPGGRPILLWAEGTSFDAADGAQAAIKYGDGASLFGPTYNGACGGDFAAGQFACAPGRPGGALATLSVPTTMNGAPPTPGSLPYGRYLYLPVAGEAAQNRPTTAWLWPSDEVFFRPLVCPAGPEPPPGWLVWRCASDGHIQFLSRPVRAGGFSTMTFEITSASPLRGVLRERRAGADTVIVQISGPFEMRSNGPAPAGQMLVNTLTLKPQTGSASPVATRRLFRGALTDMGVERLTTSGKGECTESLDANPTYEPCEYYRGLPVSAMQ